MDPKITSMSNSSRRIQACGKAVDDDVSVGEHSVQAVVVAANRQRADAQVAHVLSRCVECFVLAYTGGAGVHDVARCGHDVLHGVGAEDLWS